MIMKLVEHLVNWIFIFPQIPCISNLRMSKNVLSGRQFNLQICGFGTAVECHVSQNVYSFIHMFAFRIPTNRQVALIPGITCQSVTGQSVWPVKMGYELARCSSRLPWRSSRFPIASPAVAASRSLAIVVKLHLFARTGLFFSHFISGGHFLASTLVLFCLFCCPEFVLLFRLCLSSSSATPWPVWIV
jgi:hypothetical protein